MENVKLVVVGDGDVGKTSLLISYTTDTFPDGNTSLVFDNSPVYLDVDDMEISLGLWDTASSEGYDRLRPFSYPKTDVFLLCYSVSSQTSLQNIRSKWMPEVQHHAANVPIIIVGLKCDLRNDSNATSEGLLIAPADAEAVSKDIGAVCWIECSALTQDGLKCVFSEAVRAALSYRQNKER